MENKKADSNEQEKMIEKALRTSGFLFPKTIEEIKEYERIYGTTDVILPPDLQAPTSPTTNSKRESKVINLSENFAMAAREGKNQLSKATEKKIISDIKAAEKSKKHKKK